MANGCEASDQARNLDVSTWSGTRTTKECDLNSSATVVNHWVRIASWKTVPADIDLEATIPPTPSPLVEFFCPGVSGVTANRWEERQITVPPKQGSVWNQVP